ncbi:MAG: hypothetical protein RBR16_11015 [Syntrophus sp. (in: bacteria)]|nr:hypothetical protein [Syntrophus sp. (in: bacteria)]
MNEEYKKAILGMSDEEVMASGLLFTMPDGSKGMVVDEDGFPVVARMEDDSPAGIAYLQQECWKKFNTNPQVFTSVEDTGGYLAGAGFEFYSEYEDVQEFVYQMITDSRNRLYSFFEKYVMRAEIEGELFLSGTIHEDGFVELDFIPPNSLETGNDHKGVVYHPNKSSMPLFYVVKIKDDTGKEVPHVIPSIYVSEFPGDMSDKLRNHKLVKNKNYKVYGSTRKTAFRNFGGFQTFIISWDRGLFTDRNISHLRTVVEWANHYEELKRYEIDHKRSSGSYLWVATFEDMASFKKWVSLTDEEVEKTGFHKPKTPGGTIVLPPGMKLDCKNPNLSKISDADTDIMQMVVSGLNTSEDMVTGSNSGTYASVKASRGPEADRKEMKTERFRRFLVYDFWKQIFRIKSIVNPKFKLFREATVVKGFDDKKEPIFGKKMLPIWESLEITFPTSEVVDIESAAKGLLGVKHGSVVDTLGIPPSVVAKKLGFRNYTRMRLQHAAEDAKYPVLASAVDAADSESQQEDKELEGAQKDKKVKKNESDNKE